MRFCRFIGTIAVMASMSAAPCALADSLTTLYAFTGGEDSDYPGGKLIYHNGALYGVTDGDDQTSYGSIFKFDVVSSSYTTLYNFGGGSDGAGAGDLILHENVFYGTTGYGGGTGCHGNGCGTVFSYNAATGTEAVLYRFPDPKEGLIKSVIGNDRPRFD